MEANTTKRDDLRAEFVEWLLDPDKQGTQAQWAKDHGIHYVTLSRWKKHPEVKALLSEWRNHLSMEFGLVAANMARIAKGDGPQAVPAARLLADVFGESKQEIDLNVTEKFSKLQEQLVAIRRAAVESEEKHPN